MKTLIDRIMNNQKMIQIVNQLQIGDDDIIREILEAELTAVNGVDELIEKKLEEWDNRKPTDYLNVPGLLINIAKNDLKAIKQTPVVSEKNDNEKIVDGVCCNCGCKLRGVDTDYWICVDCVTKGKGLVDERLNDSQPKEVDGVGERKEGDCNCGRLYSYTCRHICEKCGAKIKWIA